MCIVGTKMLISKFDNAHVLHCSNVSKQESSCDVDLKSAHMYDIFTAHT